MEPEPARSEFEILEEILEFIRTQGEKSLEKERDLTLQAIEEQKRKYTAKIYEVSSVTYSNIFSIALVE